MKNIVHTVPYKVILFLVMTFVIFAAFLPPIIEIDRGFVKVIENSLGDAQLTSSLNEKLRMSFGGNPSSLDVLSLKNDLKVDDLTTRKIVQEIDREFNCAIPIEKIAALDTIKRIKAEINEKRVREWYEFPAIGPLGDKSRIIFFHVPSSWLSVVAFLMATIFSIQYLRKKNIEDDLKAHTSIQIGMIFVILATITGSVWAKFTWGSFWNWDPRETSIFALLLIYGSLFALRSAIDNEEKRATLSAVYNLIVFVTVPFFIFIMPRMMAGLHPGSPDADKAGQVINFKMNQNMQIVFYFSLIAFSMLYAWMWSVGSKSMIMLDKIKKQKLY
jgi:heme exporter protein C